MCQPTCHAAARISYKKITLVCYLFPVNQENPKDHKGHIPYGWIVGGLGIGLALVVLSIVVCVSLRSSNCFTEARRSDTKDPDSKVSHKFHILQKRSFCCASGRYICCQPRDEKQTNGESSNHQVTIPKGIVSNLLIRLNCI